MKKGRKYRGTPGFVLNTCSARQRSPRSGLLGVRAFILGFPSVNVLPG